MPRGLLAAVTLVFAATSIAAAQASAVPVADQYRRHVPILFSQGQGSAYYIAGRVQTANHVVKGAAVVLVGRDHAVVTCANDLTDSATLHGNIGPELLVGSRPWPGDRVTVAGWKRGRYHEFLTTVSGYLRHTVVEDLQGNDRVIGPVMVMWSNGDALSGMSGGPVINREGRAVGTFVAFGHMTALAVPLDGAACKPT